MSAKVRALSAVTVSTQDALLLDVVHRVREIVHVVRLPDGGISAMVGDPYSLPVIGVLPPLYPEWLGDRSFTEAHGLRFPYVAGEMANGIATTEMVIALGRAGMLGMFGAAGLPPDRIARAITAIGAALLGPGAWGINLIHTPQAPGLEQAVADLLIAHRVGVVSVSAFMDLTPTMVQVGASGLRTGAGGEIVRARRLIAKVSRPEVAAKFMAPPPRAMLDGLVASGRLAPAEADLASRLPVVQDITVEADSGGHTDNRPLLALLPRMLDLAATAQAGWLASYTGCALSSDEDLLFRNLDGTLSALAEVGPDDRVLRTKATLRGISAHDGMIIVSFDVTCAADGRPVLATRTTFGFFPPRAFVQQPGLAVTAAQRAAARPAATVETPRRAAASQASLESWDRIIRHEPHGGAAGLDRIVAERDVAPGDW